MVYPRSLTGIFLIKPLIFLFVVPCLSVSSLVFLGKDIIYTRLRFISLTFSTNWTTSSWSKILFLFFLCAGLLPPSSTLPVLESVRTGNPGGMSGLGDWLESVDIGDCSGVGRRHFSLCTLSWYGSLRVTLVQFSLVIKRKYLTLPYIELLWLVLTFLKDDLSADFPHFGRTTGSFLNLQISNPTS